MQGMHDVPSMAMILADTTLTASEVLRVFHHDELHLFLGAAFTTVGIVTALFCLLRRRFDALLAYLAIFAFLYGQRMWLNVRLLEIMLPDKHLLNLLRAVANYLMPIPAFFFFRAAGFLGRRGKTVATVMSVFFFGLVVATLVFGPRKAFDDVNNTVIIAVLLVVAVQSLRQDSTDRNFVILRRGVLVFVAFALCDNIVGLFWRPPQVEPYSFAFLLGCLGYVAGRRTLEREQQLGDIQKELAIARRIQLSILPAAFPASDNFSVAARYVPMTAVAGDLYDFLLTGNNQAGLLIADVSGHGVPAAMIASMVKLAATSHRSSSADPALLLAGMNATLCGNTQNQFVTAAYVFLDAEAGELRYSAAGHPPMLLLRDGKVIEVTENGLLLAAFAHAAFSNVTLPLEPGDRLLLYTDGILEAANAKGDFFGHEALCSLLQKTAALATSDTADRIIATIQQWAKAQDDDLTVLVCDYAGTA
jgi:phosphoserine phosphatase RsbU/P